MTRQKNNLQRNPHELLLVTCKPGHICMDFYQLKQAYEKRSLSSSQRTRCWCNKMAMQVEDFPVIFIWENAPVAPLCIDSVLEEEKFVFWEEGWEISANPQPNAGGFWQLSLSGLKQPFASSCQSCFVFLQSHLEVRIWIKVSEPCKLNSLGDYWQYLNPNPLNCGWKHASEPLLYMFFKYILL